MASTRNNSPPAELAERVAACLGRHVRPGERLVVALSGGVDSVALLHVLHRLSPSHGFSLSALHVHHGLSPHADDWQAFCGRLCGALGVPLRVARVEVGGGAGSGLEAAARRVRYAAFGNVDAEWLVLAHQRDDQAETLLFNLLRGAGLAGAAAMPAVRDFPGRPELRILRPLLEMPRTGIERYARENGLAWIEDESNRDTRHARNFLRHAVMPLLRGRFPGCDAVLARASAHFAEGEALLSQLADIDARSALREGRLVVAELARLSEARARNLLRCVLRGAGIAMPDSARLNQALRQACQAAADRQVRVDLGTVVLHRHRGELWLVQKADVPTTIEWRGETSLVWGEDRLRFERIAGGGIAMDRIEGRPVAIRPRRGGERFRPDPLRPRRELKKLLQEHGVPHWQREVLPLLWCDGELVWVHGIGVDCAWQCGPGEAGLLPVLERK